MNPNLNALLQFAAHHPIVTVLVVWSVAGVITFPLKTMLRAYKQHLRAQNIATWGWPEAPLDADGDVIYPKASS